MPIKDKKAYKAYQTEYRQQATNKARTKTRAARWYLDNKERLLVKAAVWYDENREEKIRKQKKKRRNRRNERNKIKRLIKRDIAELKLKPNWNKLKPAEPYIETDTLQERKQETLERLSKAVDVLKSYDIDIRPKKMLAKKGT